MPGVIVAAVFSGALLSVMVMVALLPGIERRWLRRHEARLARYWDSMPRHRVMYGRRPE